MYVLVSACLLGERVRYNGRDAQANSAVLERWRAEGRLVPFCPEVAGGLGVPRPPAEIQGGGGADVTHAFERGARLALDEAVAHDVRVAILKDGSPSCGTTRIADGSFSGRDRQAAGVTAALLERHGIRVFSEHQLAEADAYLRRV